MLLLHGCVRHTHTGNVLQVARATGRLAVKVVLVRVATVVKYE